MSSTEGIIFGAGQFQCHDRGGFVLAERHCPSKRCSPCTPHRSPGSPHAFPAPHGYPGCIRVLYGISPWEAPHFSDEDFCLRCWHSSGRCGLRPNNGGPIMMTISTRVLAVVSAIGLAATLASCQDEGSDSTGSETSTGSGAPTSASAPKSASGTNGNGNNGVVIESHSTSVDGKPGTVSLNSVSGTGTTVTVMFSVTNDDKKNDM